MADALVVDLASGLVSKLVSLAAEQVIQAWNLQEDLVTLQERLEDIDALLSDAHSKRLNMSAVQIWFNKLEAVARVADVFMDQLAYEVNRRKVENLSTSRHFFSTKNSLIYRFKVARKIKSINSSLDKIFEWAGKLGLQPVAQLTTTLQPREIRNTPPSQDDSLIVGRDDEISFLVQTLCTNHAEDLPVIAVLGMGGQGKTTLARMVYNRDVVTNMFTVRMWVTVSDDFDFMKILNQMVSSLTSTASVLENTEGLIKKLQSSLRGVKFLIVLDDVWNERPEEWDKLRNSLLGVGGVSGSMILVTTRKQKVVDVMRCFITHRVEKLSEEDSWELFKRRAFSRGEVLETARFAAMGRKMVERCGGLPLAIKALGGLLHSKKSEQEWLRIQDSATWDSKDDVLPSLRLSYDNLPHSSLKKCFAYCSILPKDSEIMKDEIINIWMALGFLLPPKGSNKMMEDIGSEYFNILLWNCLLQDRRRASSGHICYEMHDLVHDLALDLSQHHSVTMKADDHQLNNISKAIYVRVDEGTSNIKPPILKRNFEKVQVLYAEGRIVNDLVPYPSHLIGLVLETSNELDRLPSSLSNLKYLKYLHISRCGRMYKLPHYITRLYNLQTLSVYLVRQLPRKICNLINLRHILVVGDNYYDVDSSDMFSGIERLSCLQTLPHFVVSRYHQCVLGQLASFKNLRGTLRLFGLGNVENMEEASKASLHTKSNIEHLMLVWRMYENEEKEYNHEEVMEGLQPHTNLKELTIVNFMGKKFATWITTMTNLEVITFENCRRCEEFPQLGHLPKLRKIFISKMRNVKVIRSYLCGGQGSISGELNGNGAEETVATMYPSLEYLSLRNLPLLEEWVDPAMDTSGEDPHNVLVFPKLVELYIWRCSKLIRIPISCYPLLKTLHIIGLDSSKLLESLSKACGITELVLDDISGGVGRSSSSCSSMNCITGELLKNNSVSLEVLNVVKLHGLTYLTLGAGLKTLNVVDLPNLNTINVIKGSDALKHLFIKRCPNYEVFAQSVSSTIESLELRDLSVELDEFPWPSSFSFPNLIELKVFGWEKVKWIVDEEKPDDYLTSIFPALRRLHIWFFEGVKSLPISLANLPFLEWLSIKCCKNLESLPEFHHNFQYLEIYQCPIIEERYRKGSGAEWSKIQHIKQIDGLDW